MTIKKHLPIKHKRLLGKVLKIIYKNSKCIRNRYISFLPPNQFARFKLITMVLNEELGELNYVDIFMVKNGIDNFCFPKTMVCVCREVKDEVLNILKSNET